jgi:hypothetical protein
MSVNRDKLDRLTAAAWVGKDGEWEYTCHLCEISSGFTTANEAHDWARIHLDQHDLRDELRLF